MAFSDLFYIENERGHLLERGHLSEQIWYLYGFFLLSVTMNTVINHSIFSRSILYYFDSATANLTPIELMPKIKIRTVSSVIEAVLYK